MPESWYEFGLEQIKKIAEEDKMGQKALIQNIGNEIVEVNRKLEKLVSGFLEGIIGKDSYLEEKEKSWFKHSLNKSSKN